MYQIGPTEKEMAVLVFFAVIGIISFVCFMAWAIVWLVQHVRLV